MHLREIAPPAMEPVSLASAKAHCRVEHDEDDALLGRLIGAARGAAEDFLNRCLAMRTFELVLDDWPLVPFSLPMPPVVSVVEIGYTEQDGTTGIVLPGTYFIGVSGRLALIDGASWPTACLLGVDGVRIRYVAGYVSTEDVPPQATQAILLTVGTWYEHREDIIAGTTVDELPMGARRLLWPLRVVPV